MLTLGPKGLYIMENPKNVSFETLLQSECRYFIRKKARLTYSVWIWGEGDTEDDAYLMQVRPWQEKQLREGAEYQFSRREPCTRH
jgi:hypothetical protein